MDATYTVLTPYGIVRATFPEDAGIAMDGHEDAVAAVCRAILASIDERGMTTTPEALDPDRFVQWCQGPSSSITILAPVSIELLPESPPNPDIEDDDMQADTEDFDPTAILDGVADVSGLRESLSGASTAAEKLALAKMIREARAAAQAPPPPADNDSIRLNALKKLAPKDGEAITSDDPRLIEKLTAKLDYLSAWGDFMRKANKMLRAGKDGELFKMGFTEQQIVKFKEKDFAGRVGFADYMMSNNNGVMGSTRKRLEAAQRAAVPAAQVATIEEANAAGRAAFSAGLTATPALDPALAALLKGSGNEAGNLSAAWARGWVEANVAANVPAALESGVIAGYVTPSGKVGIEVKRFVFGDKVTYSYTGEYGAGSGSDIAGLVEAIRLTKRAKPRMSLGSGTDISSVEVFMTAPVKPAEIAPIQPDGPYPFRYALVNRPADMGTIPKGVKYTVEPRPAKGQPHSDMARHGILTTERELTAEEVKAFELAPLVDRDAMPELANKIADGMSEYAAGYLEQAKEDPEHFAAAVSNILKSSSSGIAYSVGNNGLLVQMVRDNLAAMVPADPKSAGEKVAVAEAARLRAEAAAVRADPGAADWQLSRASTAERKADELEGISVAIEGDRLLASDVKFLTEVADGKHPAMLEPELADDIEAAILRHPDDKTLQDLGESAILAYSNSLMKAT